MMTTLGYEEIARLHQERVRRSVRRQLTYQALAEAAVETTPPRACEVIEVDFAPPNAHEKVGA